MSSPFVCGSLSLVWNLAKYGRLARGPAPGSAWSSSPLAITGVAGAILPHIIVYMGYRDRILLLTFVRQVLSGLDLLQVQNGFLTESLPCTKYFTLPLLSDATTGRVSCLPSLPFPSQEGPVNQINAIAKSRWRYEHLR